MNFQTVRSNLRLYNTKEGTSLLTEHLKRLIEKKGLEIFKDIELFNTELSSIKLSPKIKAQLVLIFTCSTLSDFILNAKSDLNMVDVNNVVHNVINSTGLSYNCAIMLISDIFCACDLDFSIEYGPLLINNSVEYKLHALMPSALAKTKIKNAIQLINTYEKKSTNKESSEAKEAAETAVNSITKLCAAGIPEGFYMLGRCYLYGECGTDTNRSKALELMKIATEQGFPKAAAILGDIHYESDDPLTRDYTLAHYYYTRPGTLALDKKRQPSLQDIYKQHSANKTTLVFSGIILALMIAFLTFFHTGLFSDSNRLVIGIILTVVSATSYALSIIYNRIKSFNGIRWAVAVQYFVWALYVFILVLT